MNPFIKVHGVAAPLALANVDTDMIIPARFMTGLTRKGLGQHLFQELRYEAEGQERPGFILNQPACRNAQILLVGRNFGCGSSREHAVWALDDFGIRCVIAPSFGDIFAGNARKTGLLLVRLSEAKCDRLQDEVILSGFAPLEVDLEAQRISHQTGRSVEFSIDPDDRRILLQGLDDIDRTLRFERDIAQFEADA